jgi:hypothetical protein
VPGTIVVVPAPPHPPADGPPVQTFAPNNGLAAGWGSLAALVGVAGWVVATRPDLTGLRIVVALGLAGVVVWAGLVRPRAWATREALVLRGMLSDLHVPLAGIDHVTVRHSLTVWVGERRYHCPGIGRSPRGLARRSKGLAALLGLEGGRPPADEYATFVERRVDELAAAARREQPSRAAPVRRVWARVELTALGVLAVVLAGSLLLG